MAYRKLEEVLQDQEGAADMPTNPPQLPPLQEESVGNLKDRSVQAPPPVEPADTPVVTDEIETPQIYEKKAARGEPPILVGPRTGSTSHSSRIASGSSPPSTVGG